MLRELEDGLKEIAEGEVRRVRERARVGEVAEGEARVEEEEEVRARQRRKVEELYSVFAVADPTNMQRRVRGVVLCLYSRDLGLGMDSFLPAYSCTLFRFSPSFIDVFPGIACPGLLDR